MIAEACGEQEATGKSKKAKREGIGRLRVKKDQQRGLPLSSICIKLLLFLVVSSWT